MDIWCVWLASQYKVNMRETYEVVAVVVALLGAHADLDFVVARVARGLEEVLGQELPRLIEVIPGPLYAIRTSMSTPVLPKAHAHTPPTQHQETRT